MKADLGITAATLEYQDGHLFATLANGEVWRYRPDVASSVWVGHGVDDYSPVSAEYFADYISSVAAGVLRTRGR